MSDLSKQLTTALASLSELERLYKDMQDGQTRDDLVTIMGTGRCDVRAMLCPYLLLITSG